MKYYRRNPGDYLSATGHLTLVEHGAYNVLMDTYYATENALPMDRKALYRIAGAHDARERTAVDRVVKEFFHLDGDQLVQDRIEIEIANGREKAKKLADNGSKGGEARARNLEAKAIAIATPSDVAIAEANAKQLPKHIHQPSTINSPNGEYAADAAAPPPKPKRGKPETTLAEYLATLKTAGLPVIADDDPIHAWAERAGVSTEMLNLAWSKFKHRYTQHRKAKRYKDWRQTFRNAVEDNWFRLWYVDGAGRVTLTTSGKLTEKATA